jgi:hypothetical protein
VCSLERCGKVFLMQIYDLPPTLNIYREAHRETSHKPLQHHFYWSPAARHGLPPWPACPEQREDHNGHDQPMLLTAVLFGILLQRTRMMKCKPHTSVANIFIAMSSQKNGEGITALEARCALSDETDGRGIPQQQRGGWFSRARSTLAPRRYAIDAVTSLR